MAGGKRQKTPKKKPSVKKAPVKVRSLTLDDVIVRRTSDGELVPIETPVVGLGDMTIKVLPTTIGSVKAITAIDENCLLWPLNEKIIYVREHVVEPDMSSVTEEDVMENMTLWDLDMVLAAAVLAGGPQRSQRQGKM